MTPFVNEVYADFSSPEVWAKAESALALVRSQLGRDYDLWIGDEASLEEVRRRLDALKRAAAGADNLMPFLYEAVKAYATLGETTDALRSVFGAYEEVAVT